MENDFKTMYIVISQSGSFVSKILKFITKAEYNHVSISPYADLKEMYSFGRRFAYFPFYGGFVIESTDWGTFKRFSETEVIILSVNISEEMFVKFKIYLNYMIKKKQHFGYNYLGAGLSCLNKNYKSKKRYYCSEFVKKVLELCNANGVEKLPSITYPKDFLNIDEFKFIYKGKLKEYRENKKCQPIG